MRLLTGFFLFYVPFKSNGTVLLGTGNETSIECTAEADLTFKVISNKSNKSQTIGECDLQIKSCRIFETPLENKISLSSTGRGGLLRINSLDEETVGTYLCCETYIPNNCVSATIVWPSEVLVNNAGNCTVQPISISANHSTEGSKDLAPHIVLSIGAVGIGISLCLFILHFWKRLRQRCCEKWTDLTLSLAANPNETRSRVEAVIHSVHVDEEDKSLISSVKDLSVKEMHKIQEPILEQVRQLHEEIKKDLQNIDQLEKRNRKMMEQQGKAEKTTANRMVQMDKEKDETQAVTKEVIAIARGVCKRVESGIEAIFLNTNRGDTTRSIYFSSDDFCKCDTEHVLYMS